MHLLLDDNIHLTDLSFFYYCEQQYGINRGVYNTIDSMFYDKGIRNILMRRRTVLLFLQYVNQSNARKNAPIKFGHGGLTAKINEYWLGKVSDDEKESICEW